MNVQAIQLALIVVVIMVVVATFRDNDATAQHGSKTYSHQRQRKDPFHKCLTCQ